MSNAMLMMDVGHMGCVCTRAVCDAHARGVRRADPLARAHVDDVYRACERANELLVRDRVDVGGVPKREATPQDHQCAGDDPAAA